MNSQSSVSQSDKVAIDSDTKRYILKMLWDYFFIQTLLSDSKYNLISMRLKATLQLVWHSKSELHLHLRVYKTEAIPLQLIFHPATH